MKFFNKEIHFNHLLVNNLAISLLLEEKLIKIRKNYKYYYNNKIIFNQIYKFNKNNRIYNNKFCNNKVIFKINIVRIINKIK
jgi:hypothetical protein